MTEQDRPIRGLRLLAVDDDPLALAELRYLLSENVQIISVTTAADAVQALRLLGTESYDAVVLDISMPGLDGIEIAEILRKLPGCPELVFVAAHDDRAAEAFALDAVDYVVKPVSADRLDEVLRRVQRRIVGPRTVVRDEHDRGGMSVIPIESAGRTQFVHRRDVVYAEASGDYVRLRTIGNQPGLYNARMSLTTLEKQWGPYGFVRSHRSYLVAIRAVTELRKDPLGGQLVRVAGHDLPVSRRQAHNLRAQLQSAPLRLDDM